MRYFNVVLRALQRALTQSASLTTPSRRDPLDVRNPGVSFAQCRSLLM